MIYKVTRRGKPGPGFQLCKRCRAFTANEHLSEVTRIHHCRGVWWCPQCIEETKGRLHE